MKSSNCLYCGRLFSARKANPKYCSIECRGKGKRTRAFRNCDVCGKKYLPNLPTQRFCSRLCSDSVIEKRSGVCKRCGTEYHPGHTRQRFCSRKCFEENRKKDLGRFCLRCGGPFRTYRRNQKFCSRKCAGEGRRNAQPADNAGRLVRDEYHRMSFHIKAVIRNRKIAEQSGLCAYCDATLQRPMHIDHRTPISRGGTNDESNLCVTCARCNYRKHTSTAEEYVARLKREAAA